MSQYTQLPFPGGWVDQPWWVKADFYLYMRLSHWHELNNKLPSAEGLPNAENA